MHRVIQVYCELLSLSRKPAIVWHTDDILNALRWGAAVEAIVGGGCWEQVSDAEAVSAVLALRDQYSSTLIHSIVKELLVWVNRRVMCPSIEGLHTASCFIDRYCAGGAGQHGVPDAWP